MNPVDDGEAADSAVYALEDVAIRAGGPRGRDIQVTPRTAAGAACVRGVFHGRRIVDRPPSEDDQENLGPGYEVLASSGTCATSPPRTAQSVTTKLSLTGRSTTSQKSDFPHRSRCEERGSVIRAHRPDREARRSIGFLEC